MNLRSISNAIGNAKLFRSISYTLVFLMMACVLMTIGSLIQNVLPDWHSSIIAGVMLFILIDRLYTYQQLKSLTPLRSEWVMAHAAQWIVILLFIRLLLSYANGLDLFITDLSLFARGYLANLFTAEFAFTLLLAFMLWVLTAQFLELLDEIGLDMKWALSEESVLIQSDAVPAHQRLVNLIFSIGIVLVILTALTRIDVRTNTSGGLPDIAVNRFSGAEAGALLYFVFGLALLSLSRLMSLQTHWNRLRIPVSSDNLTRQWGKYSLFFLLILAVIVSLLPAGDSFGFFSVLGTLFSFLIGVFIFLAQLILALILLLFSLPFLLFGQAPPFMGGGAPPFPTLPRESVFPTDSSALLALVRSILLWGSLLAIIVFALIQFVRQHASILATLRKSRITNWLLLAWQWLRRNADRTQDSLSRALANGWQNIVTRLEGKRILPRMDFISVRSLDPRRRIYFFYLTMIRRGGEKGPMRKPSQTPSEYSVTLKQALPSAGEDIDSITEAFIEARYSRQEVDARKAAIVKVTWGRIRRALQSKSKNVQSPNK
jgi:Domain of unknown function (DUF4129)